MVVGRTLESVADLQRQMAARSTEKRYLLLVLGNIAEDEGPIDRPSRATLRNRQRMAVRAGRAARTHFWIRDALATGPWSRRCC